ncbi:MAG: hypothetical protein AB1405_06115, partial [Bdellovibrionota bacterium]
MSETAKQELTKMPERLRNFPGRVKEIPGKVGEGVDELARKVPFPGAPPTEERPKGFARRFFLELPEQEMEEAEGFGLIPQIGGSQETGFLYGIGFGIGSAFIKKDNLLVTASHTTENQAIGKVAYTVPKFWEGKFREEF